MSAEAKTPIGQCQVVDGAKLAGSVTADAICSDVEQAIAAHAPGVRYSVAVKVLSPARLAATLVVDGRTLPVQNFAVMDHNLSANTIKRFAQSLADAVKGASS